MRRALLAITSLVLGLTTIGVHAQQQMTVFAKIVDGTGKAAEKVEPGDITITENGAAAKVIKIEPINWPTKVQILIDNGAGTGSDNLVNIRNGVRGLIEALPEGTEVTLVTTAPQPRIVGKPTTDRAAQLKGIDLLSPDSGAGRFVESLNEAMGRILKDKTDFFPTIISLATTSGDTNDLENSYKQLLKRLQDRPATVHVVMFSKSTSGSVGGATQTEVGINVTKFMRGRYEAIAVGSRLATLLPEFGAQVAKSHEAQSHQFRITAARPDGAKGNVSNLSMSTRSGLATTAVTMDGRIP
jgi:hypothetical protein